MAPFEKRGGCKHKRKKKGKRTEKPWTNSQGAAGLFFERTGSLCTRVRKGEPRSANGGKKREGNSRLQRGQSKKRLHLPPPIKKEGSTEDTAAGKLRERKHENKRGTQSALKGTSCDLPGLISRRGKSGEAAGEHE